MAHTTTLVLGLVLLAAPLEAEVICVSRSGRLRVREACRQREATLPLSIEDGGATIRFTGVNVQIVDGSGDTGGASNGRGNLIVGYNEVPAGETRDRGGSHNLIVGPGHEFTSYGGLLGGFSNHALAPHATVVGGQGNQVREEIASITGGLENVAEGKWSAVSGGETNTASGARAAVCGGRFGRASGLASSVTGGDNNAAGGTFAVATGGRDNTVGGMAATVSGGKDRSAPDEHDWAGGSLLETE